MSNRKRQSDSRQLQLTLPLDEIESRKHRAGSMRRHEQIREALRAALRDSGLSREVVAEEVSRLTGDSVSVHHINNWTAESKDGWRLPLEYAAALMVVTGDPEILRAALSGTGMMVLDQDQAAIYELGKVTKEDMDLKKRRQEALKKLKDKE